MSRITQSQPVQFAHGAPLETHGGGAIVPGANPPRLLRLPEVEARTGLRKSTLYSLMATGDFPASIRLSRRAVAWHENEVSTFVLERVRSKVSA